jgi:hypothetical protein
MEQRREHNAVWNAAPVANTLQTLKQRQQHTLTLCQGTCPGLCSQIVYITTPMRSFASPH